MGLKQQVGKGRREGLKGAGKGKVYVSVCVWIRDDISMCV
jgi:hypothetical protein